MPLKGEAPPPDPRWNGPNPNTAPRPTRMAMRPKEGSRRGPDVGRPPVGAQAPRHHMGAARQDGAQATPCDPRYARGVYRGVYVGCMAVLAYPTTLNSGP